MNSQYYWTCPHCGANLDPGESCDCQRKEVENSENLIGQCTLPSETTDIVDNYKVVTGGVKE